jgi:hypothetical protein
LTKRQTASGHRQCGSARGKGASRIEIKTVKREASMPDSKQRKMTELLSEIAQSHPVVEDMISKLREKIAEQEKACVAQQLTVSGEYWTLVAYTHGLMRLQLIMEQNCTFVETIGLLAVTRYVFELLV